jgi:hypothetical protein
VCVVVWRDDERETTVKKNDGDGWSSDGVMLWLGMRQNENTIEWWREWSRLRWPFIAVESGSRMIWGGWPAMVMRI